MLDQIHDSHYYCRESRMAKNPSAPASTNAPSKASIVVQKELQKIKSSLPDVRVGIYQMTVGFCRFAVSVIEK